MTVWQSKCFLSGAGCHISPAIVTTRSWESNRVAKHTTWKWLKEVPSSRCTFQGKLICFIVVLVMLPFSVKMKYNTMKMKSNTMNTNEI
jgi:hypothetical protein